MLKFWMLFAICLSASEGSRNMSYYVNPGCGTECEGKASLVHVKALGEDDALHHIWDLRQKPTIFFALTLTDAELEIDWNQFLVNNSYGSPHFTKEPIYSFFVLIDEIIEFNDAYDTAVYVPCIRSTEYQIKTPLNLTWEGVPIFRTDNSVSYSLIATDYSPESKITITLSAYGYHGEDDREPHLWHTSNTAQIDFEFDGLANHFTKPRLALKLLTASTSKSHRVYRTTSVGITDNEHSPGIFGTTQVLSPLEDKALKSGAFLEWMNAAFTRRGRGLLYVTDVYDYGVHNLTRPYDALNGTFAQAYFGPKLNSLPVDYIYVSFGAPRDEIYTKSRYLTWTLTAGIGNPENGYSLRVLFMFFWILLTVFGLLTIAFILLYVVNKMMSVQSSDDSDDSDNESQKLLE